MMRIMLGGLLSLALLAGCSGADDPAAAVAAAPGELQVVDWPLPGAVPGTSAADLTLSHAGTIMLSWIDTQPGRRHSFRYSTWDTGQQRWTRAPMTIAIGNRMFVNWADTPHIAASLDGAIWAHWLQKSGEAPSAYDIALVRSPDGANWSPPLVPHDDGTRTQHGFASLWPHGTDLLGIAWLDGRATAGGGHAGHETHDPAGHAGGGAIALRAALVDPAQRLVLESVIDTRVCDCCPTSVALTSRGPLLFYRGRRPDEIRDVLVSRLEGNVWTAPRRVHADDWRVQGCPVNGPSAAGHGHAVVAAWYTQGGGEPELRMAHSADAGDSFDPPQVLDSGGNVLGRVAVALDGHQAAALWLREEAQGQSLWYARFTPDLSRELGRQQVASLQARGHASGFPRLVLHAGIAHAVWTDVVDGRPQLRGARLLPPQGG